MSRNTKQALGVFQVNADLRETREIHFVGLVYLLVKQHRIVFGTHLTHLPLLLVHTFFVFVSSSPPKALLT